MFGGAGNGDIFEFHVSEMRGGDREILIGRTPDCDVKINDKLLSKIQSHIKLSYSGGMKAKDWILYDGSKGKPSTNGTWLYINEDSILTDGVVFKANQTIFSCKILS